MPLRAQAPKSRVRRRLGHPREQLPAKARAGDDPLGADFRETARVLREITSEGRHAMTSLGQGEEPSNRRGLMLADNRKDRRTIQG